MFNANPATVFPPALAAAALALGAPATAAAQASALVGPGEALHATGTEPFWNVEIRRGRMTLKTPENQRGQVLRVRHSAARGRVVYTGAARGGRFTLTATRARCSDGMSDRTYPLTVRVRFPRYTLNGCGWTARRPFRDEG